MNRKETDIILKQYETIYSIYLQNNDKINNYKDDSRREFMILLDDFKLKKERYIIENKCIAGYENMKYIIKETYKLIFDTFIRYGKYIHYDLNEIDSIYDNLQFEMTEEENKCYKAQIKLITENTNMREKQIC